MQHQPDARLERAALAARIQAEDTYRAGVGASVALQDLDRSRLARAVGAEQRKDFAWLDGKRQAIDHCLPVVGLDQVVYFDRGRFARRPWAFSHNVGVPCSVSGRSRNGCRPPTPH